MKIKPTTVDFEMADGHIVKMCFSFARLKALRNFNKKVFDTVNKLIMDGSEGIFDYVEGLYGCYLMGSMNDYCQIPEGVLTQNEFIDLCNNNAMYVGRKWRELTSPKKITASEEHSKQDVQEMTQEE